MKMCIFYGIILFANFDNFYSKSDQIALIKKFEHSAYQELLNFFLYFSAKIYVDGDFQKSTSAAKNLYGVVLGYAFSVYELKVS